MSENQTSPLHDLLGQMEGVRQISPGFSIEEGLCATAALLYRHSSKMSSRILHSAPDERSKKIDALIFFQQTLEKTAQGFWDAGILAGNVKKRFRGTVFQKIEEIDQNLLTAFRERGYFSSIPKIHHETPEDKRQRSAVSTFSDGTGYMFLRNTSDGLPSDLFLLRKQNADTWDRWFIVLHETAHCSLRTEDNWFAPSKGYFSLDDKNDQRCVEEINRWSVDLAKNSMNIENNDYLNSFFARSLDEAFADCFAAMMLLKESDFHEGAVAAVKRMEQGRLLEQKELDRQIATFKTNDNVLVNYYHACPFALASVLAKRNDWQNLPPEKVKQKAKEYASNAFLDYINPYRSLEGNQSKSLPTYFLEALIPAAKLNIRDNIVNFIATSFAKAGSLNDFEVFKTKDHPLQIFFHQETKRAINLLIDKFPNHQDAFSEIKTWFDRFSSNFIKEKDIDLFKKVSEVMSGIPPKASFSVLPHLADIKDDHQKAQVFVKDHVQSIFEKGYAFSRSPDPFLSKACLMAKRATAPHDQKAPLPKKPGP